MQDIISNLKSRRFEASYFTDRHEAISYVLELIPEGVTCGTGGSVTLKELDILPKLADKGVTVYNRELVSSDMVPTLNEYSRTADWFITSANAITRDGQIVNIDGRANRVGALIDGPQNIVIVAGTNKITSDIESAIERIRNIAAPPNAVRLGLNTPCRTDGVCSYCDSPECMCNVTAILHHPTRGKKVYLVIIDEKLGY